MPKLEDLVKELNSFEHKDAEKTLSKVMVIAMDMNRLKFFNDTYGHAGGNKALIAFANRLRTIFKDVDFIFRPKGADEFTVLLQILKEDTDAKKIFERIKEEVRWGKPKHEALFAGFNRAWSSIRDSNVSSLITTVILFNFGTGSIRGFALTLAIGILVSMFSAITVTRTFIRVFWVRQS